MIVGPVLGTPTAVTARVARGATSLFTKPMMHSDVSTIIAPEVPIAAVCGIAVD
jgi:hypothetical protein